MPTLPSRRTVLACALVALLFASLAWSLTCNRPEVIDSPEALLHALDRAGLDYEGRHIEANPEGQPFQNPGLYLRHKGDSRPWEQLAADPQVSPEQWRGVVCVVPAGGSRRYHLGQGRGRITFGPLLLCGDPAELSRIVEALR